ncbi:E3 ubiquitin-protein ligase XIAP-like [Dreissena polymorpha]|uniref:E3 ubiquitin-protein ligase XIAP-like n=1 Tax=Dreissena polymorpha TaxID=45954 RepID=UPI002263CB93|nr:E3 ubiquitin-protein ligase XIAP-like [Dreissena polymorpha]
MDNHQSKSRIMVDSEPPDKRARTDYSLCLVCQIDNGDKLVDTTYTTFKDTTYDSLLETIHKRAALGHQEYVIIKKRLHNVTSEILKHEEASWHSACLERTIQNSKRDYKKAETQIHGQARKRGRPRGSLNYVFPRYTNPLNESESPNEENAGTENQTSQDENNAVEQSGMYLSRSEDVGHENNLKWKAAKYPKYADADKRLATYHGWPLAEPNPNTLCVAGFFFTGHDFDCVRCFCCGIGLKDFSDTDNPLLEHAKHSSNCPYIIDYFGSRSALEAYKQRFATQDPEEIRRSQRELYERQQGRPVTIYRAKHERFRTLESRLETFTHWPQHLSQRPKELADAGMYYTGVDDHCRCFACDGGLRNWEPGDDPWIEHCRWFPACPYARAVKGDEFINLVQHSADQAVEENRRDEVNIAIGALTIDDSNIQRIVEKNRTLLIQDMGFPLNDVKTAVLELVQQAITDPDIEDIITRLGVINERRPLDVLFQRTAPLEPETVLKENKLLKGLLLVSTLHPSQILLGLHTTQR